MRKMSKFILIFISFAFYLTSAKQKSFPKVTTNNGLIEGRTSVINGKAIHSFKVNIFRFNIFFIQLLSS